jgi:MoxR-like ATPase
MFNIVVTYLSEDDEVKVVTQTTGVEPRSAERVLAGEDILEFQHLVRKVHVAEEVARYAVRLVDASRPGRANSPEFIQQWVKWGAGLRASQALILGAKARALMRGRYNVSVPDIKSLAPSILRHRVITNFYAESEQMTPDKIIARLLDAVPAPRSGLA